MPEKPMKTDRILRWVITFALFVGAPALSHADEAAAPLKVIGVGGTPRFGRTVSVRFDKLAEWAAKSGNDPSKLIMFLNGRPLKELSPKAIDLSRNEIQYDIHHTEASRETWTQLLARPDAFERELVLSVGTESGPIPGTATPIKFLVVDRAWFFVFVVLLVVAMFFFVWLVRASNILRDDGPEIPGARKPYSLARTQMAIWFFLIVSSFVLIWLVLDRGDSVNTTVLALMGISSGTALGAAMVDAGKSAAAAAGTAPASVPTPSKGFFLDILQGSGGVSLHRFQMLIWTVVLGVIFVASVWNNLAMPEFSATLLGLLGISAGTYLGFKIPEKP
jgi:hypothetical protein